MRKVYITKMASFLPNDGVDNETMGTVLGMVDKKSNKTRRIILKSNGIKNRHYAIDPETGKLNFTNSDLTVNAIKGLLTKGFVKDDIECLVCGTSSPDQLAPSHAVMVHGDLGNRSCNVMSAAGICTSGIHAFNIGYLNVLAGNSNNAVVTGSELFSSITKHTSYHNNGDEDSLESDGYLAFGKEFLRWMLSDGAGAALLQSEPNKGGISLEVNWVEQVSLANEMEICMYMGGEKTEDGNFKGYRNFSIDEINRKNMMVLEQDVKLLNGRISELGVREMAKMMSKRNLCYAEVDWYLPHISSMFFAPKMYDAMEKEGVPIPMDKWFLNLPYVGNVGAASPYLMLEELFNSGKLEKGQKILVGVPESGRFSYATALLTVV